MAFRREAVIRSAEKYVSRGKIEAAIKEYRKVLADNPNDANTLNRVGDLYARIERFDEAVRLFSQIAEQYTQDGFFVKAIAIYKKIIKLDPTALQVYEKLAALYAKQGLVTEARTQYQVLADYYQKHDNAASAITIYQRMAELEPDNPAYRLKLAELYASRSLVDKALLEYRRLADIFVVNGSFEEAAQVYLKALDTSARDVAFIEHAVGELRRHGQDAAAARVLAKANELDPEAARVAERGATAAAAETAASARSAQRAADPSTEIMVDAGSRPGLGEVSLDPAGSEAVSFDGEMATPFGDESSDIYEIDLESSGGLPPLADDAAPPSPPSPPPPPQELSDVFTFELDLDDDEVPESLVQPPSDMVEKPQREEVVAGAIEGDGGADAAPVEPSGVFSLEIDGLEDTVAPEMESMEIEFDIDTDFSDEIAPVAPVIEPPPLEPVPAEVPAAAEPEPATPPPAISAVRRGEDLLAEAQVFAKYGLRQKAEERLETLQELHPDHLGGLLLAARIRIQASEHSDAIEKAYALREAARAAGDTEPWELLAGELADAGFTVDGDEIVAEPGAQKRTSDRISHFLERLDESGMHLVASDDETGAAAEEPDAEVSEPAAEEVASDAAPAEAVSAPAAPPIEVADETAAEVAAEAQGEADDLDDSSMSWLDEVIEPAAVPEPADDAVLFDEENDFFDLAAELERELSEEDPAAAEAAQPQEQSLEDIVEGFKRGVAEHLSAEDYDTHFNLGIAYREMGLLDEAIGEFQLASKDERYLVEASSMLGICFLDKGLPELALKWYRKGLESPAVREEETLGLLYEMALVYLSSGDTEMARETLVEIYGMNSNFRDVANRIAELEGSAAGGEVVEATPEA